MKFRPDQANELEKYLKSLYNDATAVKYSALRAWSVWCDVDTITEYLIPVPRAIRGEQNQIYLRWELGKHKLQFEVLVDTMVKGTYYKNNKKQWEGNWYSAYGKIPEDCIELLPLFIENS